MESWLIYHNTQNLCSLQVSVLTLPYKNLLFFTRICYFSIFHRNGSICGGEVAARWWWWAGTYPTGGCKWLACWLTLLTV